jgi:hypothetical protein
MARTITHNQYAELREYADHSWRWVNGGPMASLVAAGLIVAMPHDRSMYAITEVGTSALEAYRTRWGIREAV